MTIYHGEKYVCPEFYIDGTQTMFMALLEDMEKHGYPEFEFLNDAASLARKYDEKYALYVIGSWKNSDIFRKICLLHFIWHFYYNIDVFSRSLSHFLWEMVLEMKDVDLPKEYITSTGMAPFLRTYVIYLSRIKPDTFILSDRLMEVMRELLTRIRKLNKMLFDSEIDRLRKMGIDVESHEE